MGKMAMNESYISTSEAALARKIEQMDREALPNLREQYKVMLASFQGVHALLIKKGVLHEDPYRFDQRISEVNTPPEGAFTEAEKNDEMSVRFSQYEAQLEFLCNYYQFSFTFLDMERVKRLISLTRYFNYSQLSSNASNINTRVFTEMVDQVRKGTDQLSSGLVNDAINHLDRASRQAFQLLKELTLCHKEGYKLELRKEVLSLISFEREYVVSHQDEVLRQIKRKFLELFPQRQFYQELAQDVLREDYSQESEGLREAVLKELAVKETAKPEKKERNFKSILLEGTRVLSTLNLQLEDAVRKLEDNAIILESENDGVWARIKRMLAALVGRGDKPRLYELEYVDPLSSAQKTERLDFGAFCDELRRRSKLYAGLASRSGAAYQRMESAREDQLYGYLEKNIEDLQLIQRRLLGLDTFFKSEVGKENRNRLRGVKLEVEAVKATIVGTNQKKHEYVAQKEELEQMRKLGINVD